MENNIDLQKFVQDPELVKRIDSLINTYNLRPGPGKGLRYKRCPEDTLKEQGNFNALYFLEEFLNSLAKKSRQPKAIRDCITRYVITAINNMYQDNPQKYQNNGTEKESGDQGPVQE